ncbi:MAG TPA: tetratricopeptide repeat protein [Rhizomicrobium sp.]|jgi:TPR repeat protein
MRTIVVAFACLCLPFAAQGQAQSTPILGNAPLLEQPQGAPPVPGDQPTFNGGVTEYDRGDYVDAYKTFLYLAERDDVAAMRNVALMKRRGLGTPRDPEGAMEYLKEAADDGLPTAAADLAEMLLYGEGGQPDPQSALPWLEQAAKAHHALAEFRLAEIYERGLFVTRDVARAEQLYADAAAAGVPQAATRLNLLKSGVVSPPRP